MQHERAFDISDENYGMVSSLAAKLGQKPEDPLEQWLREVRAQASARPSVATANGQPSAYDPAIDPLASYLGAFEATAPDVVRRHDAFTTDQHFVQAGFVRLPHR